MIVEIEVDFRGIAARLAPETLAALREGAARAGCGFHEFCRAALVESSRELLSSHREGGA